jgi:hypothetical protein
MRKIVLLFVVFGFLSCKDKKDTSNETKLALTSKINDDSIYKYARELREKDDSICTSNLSVESFHKVEIEKFNDLIANFWGKGTDTSNVPFKEIPYVKIKGLMKTTKCYDEYICMKGDTILKNVTDIDVDRIDTFSLKKPCYSKPLFRELERKYGLKDEDVLKFTKARSNNRFTIIFMVKGNTSVPMFFDITDWPG